MADAYEMIDRLAVRIIDGLHKLFGFQYNEKLMPYYYHATVNGADADAIGTVYNTSIRISQEADFICTRIQGVTRLDDTGVVIGASSATTAGAGDFPDFPATIKIKDGSKDRDLMNEAVDFMAAFGTYGGLPGTLPKPYLFRRNTIANIQLTSLKVPAASTGFDYRIVFVGYKVFDLVQGNLQQRRA